MRKILLIGIGAGDPNHLTLQAIDALNEAQALFIPDKGDEKASLRRAREEICRRFIKNDRCRQIEFKTPRRDAKGDYRKGVAAWHVELEKAYERLFAEELAEGECGAFLVWGDPTLYDSTLRIVEAIRAKGFPLDYRIIPGITAVQALAAKHKIALNRIGEPVLITTGRKLAERQPADDVVVMLDGEQAFARVDDEETEIYWGAYLGMEEEILIAGQLRDVRDSILAARAAAREKNGWIMDVYLLRKTKKS